METAAKAVSQTLWTNFNLYLDSRPQSVRHVWLSYRQTFESRDVDLDSQGLANRSTFRPYETSALSSAVQSRDSSNLT